MRARSAPNIALIKYWGNRDDALRLPAADSLSMTLSSPIVEVDAEPSDTLTIRSYETDGMEKQLKESDTRRFATHLGLCRRYLASLGHPDTLPPTVTLAIRSQVPPSIGLASSAAVFSAVAMAYAGLIRERVELSAQQISVLARLGSGSACRSILGGFTAMRVTGDGIGDAYAEQIAPEDHWPLHDIVIAPTRREKSHGSTEGHALAPTSRLYTRRIADIPRRQQECIDAILKRDFEKLQAVSEEDCLNMHDVMRTSAPALDYLTADTHRIVREIDILRREQHLPVLYTMDAGPTVHLLCTDDARDAVIAYARSQAGCQVFESQVGPGVLVIE